MASFTEFATQPDWCGAFLTTAIPTVTKEKIMYVVYWASRIRNLNTRFYDDL